MGYEKIIKDSIYTLDKLVLEFMMRFEDAQFMMDKLSMMVNVNATKSNKRSVCRYGYNIDLDDNNSFWIGFEPNWKKSHDKYIKWGRVEFNPSKVAEDLQFQSIYSQLLSMVSKSFLVPVRFDLAIDIPVARDKVHLIKDHRLYEEYSLSSSNRTQYLGVRNNHGRVKLYNKALELKLDSIDLTRLELTVNYDKRDFKEVQSLIPKMYVMDSFQFPIDIDGTDKVIMFAIMQDLSLLRELGRRKREKIEGYLEHTLLSLKLDAKKYNHVLDYINTFL